MDTNLPSQNNDPPIEKKLGILRLAENASKIGLIGIPFCFFGIIFGIVAVIMGTFALMKIKNTPDLLPGRKYAIRGIVFGIISLVIWIPIMLNVFCCYREAQIVETIKKVKAEQQTIATALESYYTDYNCYPSPDHDAEGKPVLPHVLTTPVAYLKSLPFDPFKNKGKGYYGYGSYTYSGWIVTSYGPDKVDGNSGEPGGKPLDQSIAWSDTLGSFATVPLQQSPFTYDPTNGTVSAGDIWRRGP